MEWLSQMKLFDICFFQPTERSRSAGKKRIKTRWLRLRSADLFLGLSISQIVIHTGWNSFNLAFIAAVFTFVPQITNASTDISGHIKGTVISVQLEDNDIASIYGDNSPNDLTTNKRLNLKTNFDNWQFQLDIDSSSISGDTVENTRLVGLSQPRLLLGDDSRRAMQLSKNTRDNNRSQNNFRLDRLNGKYQTENWQVTLGRQVISWGNGLAFQPLDLFNPFSPAAIDTDYKTGDDMLTGQYLFESGVDLQGISVFRRNIATDKIDSDYFSHAIKWHQFAGKLDQYELDIMAARHYQDDVLGFGVVGPIGESLGRFNLVLHKQKTIHNQQAGGLATSAIANVDYSWTWINTNYYGFIEYSHSDFGVKNLPEYSFQIDSVLLEKLARGEIYNYGRDYLATGITIDLHPLATNNWIVIANLHDHSTLVQTTVNIDPSDNTFIQLGVALPIGDDNTEYGGIRISDGVYKGQGRSVFVRGGVYF